MAIAQIGPLTILLEAFATAVGAGVVIGSVAVGVDGLWKQKPIREIERHALIGGYVGGATGAVFALIDVILRYGM
jgi:hypothetical protein